MGYGQVTHCSNCSDEKEYTLGAGMAFGDLFNVIDNFPKGAQNKLKYISSLHEIEQQDLSYEVFECRQCDTSHSRLHLTIKYDGKKWFSPNYRCSECKHKLFRSNRPLTNFKCRKCKKYALQNSKVSSILWD